MSDLEEKARQARIIIQEWVGKQGHDRCWYYPDIFMKLAKVFDVKYSRELRLPPLKEFKTGCERYQEEEYRDRDKH